MTSIAAVCGARLLVARVVVLTVLRARTCRVLDSIPTGFARGEVFTVLMVRGRCWAAATVTVAHQSFTFVYFMDSGGVLTVASQFYRSGA